jgi:hypothetical protein
MSSAQNCDIYKRLMQIHMNVFSHKEIIEAASKTDVSTGDPRRLNYIYSCCHLFNHFFRLFCFLTVQLLVNTKL